MIDAKGVRFICVEPITGNLEIWKFNRERDYWERLFLIIRNEPSLNGISFSPTGVYLYDCWLLDPINLGREIIDTEIIE